MSLSRPLVAFLGVGILGIAGVGLGAGATFTDSTHSLQTITAGSINVTLTAKDATGADWLGVTGQGTKTLTLPDLLLTGSAFQSAPIPITMTNNGSMAANMVVLNIIDPIGPMPTDAALLSQWKADRALRNELGVCISSPAGNAGGLATLVSTLQNTPIPGAGYGMEISGAIAPNGGTDSYMAEFFAGDVLTQGCGQTGYNSLPATAMGGQLKTKLSITYTE